MPETTTLFRPKQMYHRTLVPVFAKTKEQEAELKANGYQDHYLAQAFPMRIFHPTDPNVEPKVITKAEQMEEGWVDTPATAREYAKNPKKSK